MKVSILSPIYNEEKHIGEMISSVLRQDYVDFELIFVDDGSNDKTADIVEGYCKKDDRIRLVSRGVKLGKARAFNKCYSESNGEMIILMGGDDTLPVDSISTRVNALLANKTDIASGKLITMSESKKHDKIIIPKGNRENLSGGTIILSRSICEKIFPIDERLPNEDTWILASIKFTQASVSNIQKIVLNYRIHQGNSNPRHSNFKEFNEKYHDRMLAFEYVRQKNIDTISEVPKYFSDIIDIEEMRFRGNILGIIFHRSNLRLKLSNIFYSNRILFWVRNRLFRLFSGA